MNYCILNGVKSTLVQGLLIQTLPPISKPLMRTQVEEIDGRDGDVVQKLGYSAYNKEMSIGLFGDFDIDAVIQYFDSEGTVIFSNEPDKFYRYQIIEQIDFEKLLRFKTATVTFHCQPFKFSAVDDAFSVSKDQMSVRPYTETRNGVTITAEGGKITVEGEATRTTEFYVPIAPMTLDGDYTLQATVTGTGESACQIRVIGSVPSDADSFGNTYLQLDSTATLQAEVNPAKTFNYVWFSITSGTEMDYELDLMMLDDDLSSFKAFNRGNTTSRPTLTIYGSGTIVLSVNGVELFTINLANNGYITIDAIEMNAYKGDTLMNRSVAGDYSKLVLKAGSNTISWTGNVTKIEVENVSRWI